MERLGRPDNVCSEHVIPFKFSATDGSVNIAQSDLPHAQRMHRKPRKNVILIIPSDYENVCTFLYGNIFMNIRPNVSKSGLKRYENGKCSENAAIQAIFCHF